MAKMERKEIVVKDIVKGVEYKSMSETTPRQSEPGNYIYLKLNPCGIAFLQSKGQVENTVSTKAFEDWFCEKTGMSKNGIGTLGSLKDPADAATKWQVTVNGRLSFPHTPVAAPVVIEQPIMMAQPVAPQPVMAMTDTALNPLQEKLIAQIRNFLKEGKTKEELVAGLSVRMTPVQAVEMITRAEMPVLPPAPLPPKPSFSFDF